jgi:F-type H+-transporting ATPase subunit epsilon
MSQIHLQIVTPLGSVYSGNALEVIVPTVSGMITILPRHIPLVSVLKSGELRIQTDSGSESFAVHGGVVEIKKTEKDVTSVVLLADRSERAQEIDTQRAEEAYKRAKELREGLHDASDVDFARFESMMDKELNRIHIGRKYK